MPSPAPVNGYCTLAELRASPVLSWPAADTTQDQFFCDIITAVSRAIDGDTGRHFYKSSAHEVRYFTAVEEDRLYTGDLVSVTSLATDDLSGPRTYGITWAATDYDLMPYDAGQQSEAEPYRWIEVTPRGVNRFPKGLRKGVALDGVFGWPAVPSPIAKATLLWAERIFKRYSTPLGSQSMNGLGGITLQIMKTDPDIVDLYSEFKVAGF